MKFKQKRVRSSIGLRHKNIMSSWNSVLIDQCDHDHVCHFWLKDGMRVKIKWPNGIKTKETIFVEDSKKAYIYAKNKGADCRVYIAGLDIKVTKL